MSRTVVAALALAALLAPGCAAKNDATACRTGSDCASGACDIAGRCVPVVTPDTGAEVGDTGAEADVSPDTFVAETDASPGCTITADGTIGADKVPAAAGFKATFRVAQSVAVNTAGTDAGGGLRKWDLSTKLAGDKDILVETLAPSGAWWAGSFTGATYATPLSITADTLGIFQVTAAAITLRGAVSPTGGTLRTELTYATPPRMLAFPLKLGATWTDTSNVTGLTSGVTSYYTEKYDAKVDQRGELSTPFGSFPVLRVKMVLTRTLGTMPTVIRTYAFVSPCFGTIAQIVSQTNELSEEFTTASEVKRLAP